MCVVKILPQLAVALPLLWMAGCANKVNRDYCVFPSPSGQRSIAILQRPLEVRIGGRAMITSGGDPGLAEAAWSGDSSRAAWLICLHKEDAIAGGYDWTAGAALSDADAVSLVAPNIRSRYDVAGGAQAAIKWACSEAGHQRFASEVTERQGLLRPPR